MPVSLMICVIVVSDAVAVNAIIQNCKVLTDVNTASEILTLFKIQYKYYIIII